MRVGIIILPEFPWAEAQHRWRRAEEYGFDHAWTYDHLGWRDLVDGPWFDAVPTLTAAALVTSTIPLGTFVASANFRHPVEFARAITALDDVSQGRVLLGLGAGGRGFDQDVLGQPRLTPRANVDRFTEFVSLLDELLRNDRVTFKGEHFAAVDARSTPGCVQQPRVPFVVAANAPRSLRLAARLGDGWVTVGERTADLEAWWHGVAELNHRFTEALQARGRDPGGVRRYLSLDAAPLFALTSRGAIQDAVGRARTLGFTDVVVHWPRPSRYYVGDESILDDVAAALPALRGADAVA